MSVYETSPSKLRSSFTRLSHPPVWWSCRSHLALISLQTAESDCFDVPVGCPAASTVARLWRSSARHDKTPCFGFWVRRAFLGLLHSKSLTFTILLTSHNTFELNKLPHQYKLSIVYERGIKKEGKLLMWEKWARSQTLIFADFTEIIHKNGNYRNELVVPAKRTGGASFKYLSIILQVKLRCCHSLTWKEHCSARGRDTTDQDRKVTHQGTNVWCAFANLRQILRATYPASVV